MRITPTACLALLLLLPGPGAHAQTRVQRCISAEGTPVFTDRRCEQLGAHESMGPEQPILTESEDPAADPFPAEPVPEAYGPVSQDCARTPTQLRDTVERQLREHDINGLAGLYHWPGTGQWSARTVMDRLETLAAHSDGPAELHYPESAFVVFNPEAWPDLPPEDPIGLRVPLHASDPDAAPPWSEIELRTIRHAGCWWLHF